MERILEGLKMRERGGISLTRLDREREAVVFYFLTILRWCKLVMMCELQSFLTRAALLDNLRFRQKPPERS